MVMMSVNEIKAWLDTLGSESQVAVDDGGLALVEISASGEETGAYLEIGGIAGSIWGD
jgi:hypothetical protein